LENTNIKLNKELTFTWAWKDHPKISELVSVKLIPKIDGTTMIFEHSNIDKNSTHDYEAGWISTFKKLEKTMQDMN
jgi:hypothetical protein